MIDKLRKKIFWIIQLSLTSIVLIILILYSVLNYKNTINSATMMVDRFAMGDIRKNPKPEELERQLDIDLEGVYVYSINQNLEITKKPELTNAELENYAKIVSTKKSESGIIGKYIYKARRIRNNEQVVTLIENESIINHIRYIFFVSIGVGATLIVIIYVIAKRVAKTIVKPAEETLEKQKQFISDASHELKTPLAVIETNSDVLLRRNWRKQMDKLYTKRNRKYE